jgi:hypothetical protein
MHLPPPNFSFPANRFKSDTSEASAPEKYNPKKLFCANRRFSFPGNERFSGMPVFLYA